MIYDAATDIICSPCFRVQVLLPWRMVSADCKLLRRSCSPLRPGTHYHLNFNSNHPMSTDRSTWINGARHSIIQSRGSNRRSDVLLTEHGDPSRYWPVSVEGASFQVSCGHFIPGTFRSILHFQSKYRGLNFTPPWIGALDRISACWIEIFRPIESVDSFYEEYHADGWHRADH